eukprot:2862966-Rhodomonas_salina.1
MPPCSPPIHASLLLPSTTCGCAPACACSRRVDAAVCEGRSGSCCVRWALRSWPRSSSARASLST